jgi:hypothetical protein
MSFAVSSIIAVETPFLPCLKAETNVSVLVSAAWRRSGQTAFETDGLDANFKELAKGISSAILFAVYKAKIEAEGYLPQPLVY